MTVRDGRFISGAQLSRTPNESSNENEVESANISKPQSADVQLRDASSREDFNHVPTSPLIEKQGAGLSKRKNNNKTTTSPVDVKKAKMYPENSSEQFIPTRMVIESDEPVQNVNDDEPESLENQEGIGNSETLSNKHYPKSSSPLAINGNSSLNKSLATASLKTPEVSLPKLPGYVCNTNDLQVLTQLENEKRVELLRSENEKLDKKIENYSLQKEVLGSQISKIEKDINDMVSYVWNFVRT